MSWLIFDLSSLGALTIVGCVAIRRRRQRRFIRHMLARNSPRSQARVVASLTTLPDRIQNLGPTIRSLLNQTRPPGEIVLAIPEFSVRQKPPYSIPKYLSQSPALRIVTRTTHSGPATTFTPPLH